MKEQLLTEPSKDKVQQDGEHHFHSRQPFLLESGETLPELSITYHTWGQLNEARDNVIWICHALTANSNAKEWWPNLVGEGLAFDTNNYFVICANILGSCYGTTGPSSVNAATGKPFLHSFPFITIRDMVKAHVLLREHLCINSIYLLAGGSMGGYQVLEWAVIEPQISKQLFVITTSAKESAWGVAIHTAQRMAIETDPSWTAGELTDGRNGLKVARAIGMLTYRSYESFVKTQSDTDPEKVDQFMASSYIRYQGEKLANRFTAYSYWTLSKALDSHNLARSRGSMENVLTSICIKTLIIGITSDLLCPLQELQFLARHIPNASFVTIDSLYGHDGFLVETDAITQHLAVWLSS